MCKHPGVNNTTGLCIACGEFIDHPMTSQKFKSIYGLHEPKLLEIPEELRERYSIHEERLPLEVLMDIAEHCGYNEGRQDERLSYYDK